MEVITTHTNADFDALASMVAAKKIYPAHLLFFQALKKGVFEIFLFTRRSMR